MPEPRLAAVFSGGVSPPHHATLPVACHQYFVPRLAFNQPQQVGLFKLGGEVFAYFLVDRTGRRPLFITSSSLVTFFLVLLGAFSEQT